jgi:hypothetical protein
VDLGAELVREVELGLRVLIEAVLEAAVEVDVVERVWIWVRPRSGARLGEVPLDGDRSAARPRRRSAAARAAATYHATAPARTSSAGMVARRYASPSDGQRHAGVGGVPGAWT